MIHDFHGSVTLTSADPSRPAVLTSLKVTHSSGITLKNLTLDNEAYPANALGAGTRAFQILGSSQISLLTLDVQGSPQGSLETDQAGILVRDSDHVTIESSNFHNLHNGVAFLDSSYLVVRNNDFHDLRDDGIDAGGASNVLIEGNHCHSNHPDGVLDKDHPDCIQFWTANTKVGAHDIVIVGNHYERERGHATQFIFMGNENHLRYDHVVIKDNVSVGSAWNAIRVVYAHDVSIENNLITSLCAPDGGQTLGAWIATKDIDGLVLKHNIAGSFPKLGGDTAVSDSGNSTKSCIK
jgi:parallel beta-helix repeat protein